MDFGSIGKLLKTPTLTEQLRSAGVREDLVIAAGRTAFGRQSDRSVFDLPAVLSEDEAVTRLLEGRHQSRTGLLVLTTRRLVFAPRSGDRTHPTVVPLTEVAGVTWRKSRGLGLIEVTTGSGSVVVDQILGKQAEWICDEIRDGVAHPSDQRAVVRDPVVELAELRALHRAGAIEDDEFEIRKRELFGRI